MRFKSVDWLYHEDNTNDRNPSVRSWVVTKNVGLPGKPNEVQITVRELLSGDIFMFISSGEKQVLFYPSNEQEILVIANCFEDFGN